MGNQEDLQSTITNLSGISVDDILKRWERAYSEVSSKVATKHKECDDLELFSAAYHKLVHSPSLDSLLQAEHMFSAVMHNLVKQRDEQLNILARQQTEEMTEALECLNLNVTEGDITEIAKRHQEEHGIEIASWESKLETIRENQKSEYRNWLMSLLELRCHSSPSSPFRSSPNTKIPGMEEEMYSNWTQTPQESFTIHLGSQMKQMYNIRILSADVMDFCRLRTNEDGELERQPQRMQTALGLYSNDLSGVVLLSDNHLGGFSGFTKDLVKICEMSTELHFPSINKQLESIREYVKQGIEWRKLNAICDANLLTFSEQQSRKSGTKYLQAGDAYVTKHSNLSDVHAVFHLVADDSLKSADISSRHPTILGLRNIMKCACINDVTTLTIPILLTHELFDELTLSWCNKRAELVFKCVKGFMIEMASWGGTELKNLQFLVPKGISEDIFQSLAGMVPSIFRVSNPLVLKVTT